MKITLDTNSAARELLQDTNASWSRNGALALIEYFEECERDYGQEMELDVVAIRCDWSEYETALEAAGECGWIEESENYTEEGALEWLRENTVVIEFDGGVIVHNF